MELLYLFIGQANNIVNQQFCFSTNYEILFELSENSLSIINKKQDNNFFGSSFVNVTALIGKNGSGKTTLLNFIKSLFSQDSYFRREYILVLKDNKGVIRVFNKTHNRKQLVINSKIENKIVSINEFDYNDLISEINLIFYSYSFSIYSEGNDKPFFIDISLNRSLEEMLIKANEELIDTYDNLLIEEAKSNNEKNLFMRSYLKSSKELFSKLYKSDLTATLKFITKHQEKREDWHFIPDMAYVSFNTSFFINNREYYSLLFGENILFFENEIYLQLENDPNNKAKNFKNKLIAALFLNVCLSELHYGTKSDRLQEIVERIKTSIDRVEIIALIEEFFNEPAEIHNFNKTISRTKQFVHSINDKFNNFSNVSSHYKNYYSLILSDTLCNTIQDLFDIWDNYEFIFNFSWLSLSAGESALLTMFSRINDLSGSLFRVKNPIWLLIDEGDLYLHPEWQRTFLNDLHKYLPKMFPETKIQLILTSHSPFLVSDLPRENILLLEKVDWQSKVVDSNVIPSSFGANIHTLYTEAFFMNNGLIGEFSKLKISSLINFLNDKKNKKTAEFNELSSKQLIEIIGEPILKTHLQNMWREKFGTESPEETIETLRKEIDYLKAENNSLKNQTDK